MEQHFSARAEELSLQINCLHVSYLQSDESPQKIEERTKLENILRCSVEMKSTFSAYRASTAWNAIARYAANLVAQPWRREFRFIKTFSGFYMHDIEENLAYADRLLDCMGYKRVDHSSLVLEQPIDLDAVINVSRDAIVAFVECQIMREIWEGIYPQFECSWLEILNYRETHICTPESAIKNLSYLYHQNRFHHQQSLSSAVNHDPFSSIPRLHHHSPLPNCLFGQTMSPQMNASYYGFSSYPSCVVPPQPRYACVINPQQMGYSMPPAGYQHQCGQSPVTVNGCDYPHSHQVISSPCGRNGYMMSQTTPTLPQNYNCVVPTGQLIELDNNTSNASSCRLNRISMPIGDDIKSLETKNGNAVTCVEGANSSDYLESPKRESLIPARSDGKSVRPTTLQDLKPRRNGLHIDHVGPSSGEESHTHVDKCGANKQSHKQFTRKVGAPGAAIQDGTGTWESWDYVYRNLESQGYNKDVGERGDILHSSMFPRRSSIESAGSSPNINSTVARNSRNVQDVEVPITSGQPSLLSNLSDEIQSLQLNFDNSTNGVGVDTVDARLYDMKNGTVKDKVGAKGLNLANKPSPQDQKREDDTTFSSMLKSIQPRSIHDKNINIWECVFCTYHNKYEKCVCEMCGKSRQPGNEDKPLVSGGRECPKCTLVNARGVVSCEACNESLKNSPTYI